jgi:hypothetical protein
MVCFIGTSIVNPVESSTSNQQENMTDQVNEEDKGSYIVRCNDTIIGIFENKLKAQDAITSYQMENDVDINDTFEIWQGNQIE